MRYVSNLQWYRYHIIILSEMITVVKHSTLYSTLYFHQKNPVRQSYGYKRGELASKVNTGLINN